MSLRREALWWCRRTLNDSSRCVLIHALSEACEDQPEDQPRVETALQERKTAKRLYCFSTQNVDLSGRERTLARISQSCHHGRGLRSDAHPSTQSYDQADDGPAGVAQAWHRSASATGGMCCTLLPNLVVVSDVEHTNPIRHLSSLNPTTR